MSSTLPTAQLLATCKHVCAAPSLAGLLPLAPSCCRQMHLNSQGCEWPPRICAAPLAAAAAVWPVAGQRMTPRLACQPGPQGLPVGDLCPFSLLPHVIPG